MKTLVTAIRVALVTLVLTGIVYPLAVTGFAQALFPEKANGSLVRDPSGAVRGSEFLAQGFTSKAYLQPRPSAAGNGYDPQASGGSNLGPTSKKLRDRVAADVDRLTKENPGAAGPVPLELVTQSASGLDPELSPTAAEWQVARIAAARGVAPERISEVVRENIAGRSLGILGEPRVNVLMVNLALDQRFGAPAREATPTPTSTPAAVDPTSTPMGT